MLSSTRQNPISTTEILELAKSASCDILRWRRHLHQHPELSCHEAETAKFLNSELAAMGLMTETSIGNTYGLRAIAGNESGPVVALRADMDALPIQEESDLGFASVKSGVMHACGHDAHMAMLLGAARILTSLTDRLPGRVVFIFQPAEEHAPGGAQAMIAAGVLDNPRPNLIIGQHVNPELPAGTVGFRPGLMMASVDDLFITIKGSGGHGAMPHLCIDPITISAQIINAAQTVVSRMADPQVPCVLTFGKISGLGSTNIIPGLVHIEGTFRTVDETWREAALERIQNLVNLMAQAQGAEAQITILRGYPALFNHIELTKNLHLEAARLLGKEMIRDLPLFMGAEDFAYYGRQIPACFFILGAGFPQRDWNAPLHHPALTIDESALATGAATMAWLAVSQLQNLACTEPAGLAP